MQPTCQPRPSRWFRLWQAIKSWWRNDPSPAPPDPAFLNNARHLLVEYDNLYCARTGVSSSMAGQAAMIVLEGGYKRSPAIESEVRVLAIAVERLVGHLEMERDQRERQRAW